MHPEIREEQAYFDRALELRDRLEANLGRAARLSADPKTATELRRRVGALGVVDPSTAVAFGRIEANGSKWYIGKGAIWDEDNELVVVNWQAPIAAPFYVATPDQPEGLDARRIYRCANNRILDIEEMIFNGLKDAIANGDQPGHAKAGRSSPETNGTRGANGANGVSGAAHAGHTNGDAATGGAPSGREVPDGVAVSDTKVSDVLLAELGRTRSGELADIVATIQAAQYDIITRDIEQLLIVQGGPGTGKTVVGLHRVSWMLYNRRDRWQPNDVLVVGPNPAFIRYISSVLPSLGDEAVVQLPITSLGPRVKATRVDPVEVRRLKGDRRMLRLLLRAVRNRQKPQRGPIDLQVAGRTVRLDGDRIVARAQQLAGAPHNDARRALRSFVMDEVQAYFSRRGLRGLAEMGKVAEPAAGGEATREIENYLDRIWPSLTAPAFLVDLFSTRRRLEAAAVGLLDSGELSLLAIPTDTKVSTWTWAVDDVPLLDMVDALLNGTPTGYQHIVVDEAQDLSPMQLESIRRRSRTGWMTVLGDLAQATSPWAPESWEEVALHLRRDRVPTEIAELSLGYRLPQEVHDVAMRLLPEVAPRSRAPRAVRASGHDLEAIATRPEDLTSSVVETARQFLGSGLVAVVVAERDRAQVSEAFETMGLEWATELAAGAAHIVVLTAEEAKGLEFDNVLVVEPAHVAEESPQGLRALFVALTRTTNRLALVHAEPLPAMLEVESALPPPAEPSPPAPQPELPPLGALPGETLPAPHGADVVDIRDRSPREDRSADDTLHPPPTRHFVDLTDAEDGVGEAKSRESLAALDQEMARAIANKLAETLSRYVRPSLIPLVLEEMRDVLDQDTRYE